MLISRKKTFALILSKLTVENETGIRFSKVLYALGQGWSAFLWKNLAKGCGMADTVKVYTWDELKKALIRRTGFIHVIAKPVNAKCPEIPLSAKEIRDRFMEALRE